MPSDVEPLNQEQVAALLGVSTVTVQRRQRDKDDPLPMISGGKGRGNRAQYDPASVGQWMRRQITGQSDEIDLERERAMNLRADTRLKELKEQQMRSELASVSLMTETLALLGGQISAILESIPAKLKRRLPQLTAADIDIVTKEIVKCQNACADLRIEPPDVSRDDAGAGVVPPPSSAAIV